MDDFTATSSAALTNPIGLHARPSVKLTKLAKRFESQIELAPAERGAQAMYALTFVSDRGTAARVTVRKSRNAFDAWNVDCINI